MTNDQARIKGISLAWHFRASHNEKIKEEFNECAEDKKLLLYKEVCLNLAGEELKRFKEMMDGVDLSMNKVHDRDIVLVKSEVSIQEEQCIACHKWFHTDDLDDIEIFNTYFWNHDGGYACGKSLGFYNLCVDCINNSNFDFAND